MKKALGRRDFIRAAVRPPRDLELSCERLYMKYMDAAGEGRLAEFLADLRAEIAEAGHVRLTGVEWLGQQDFRAALDALLAGAGYREGCSGPALRESAGRSRLPRVEPWAR